MPCIRPAVSADLPRLVELAQRSSTAAQWNSGEYAKLFAPGAQQNRIALAVEDGGQVVGFIVGRQLDTEWEIENIIVSEPAQRQGLGSLLLDELIELARSRAGREIFLEVRESNHAARALYKKHGFLETGRRKQYYDSPAEDALILKYIFPQASRFPLNVL